LRASSELIAESMHSLVDTASLRAGTITESKASLPFLAEFLCA
jgi:hypothetical protein